MDVGSTGNTKFREGEQVVMEERKEGEEGFSLRSKV
jgi:hypothetical protein